jgi:hypothetical protein
MNESSEDFGPFGIHIVLATIPQTQEKIFQKSIQNDFYNGYLTHCKKNCKKDNFHDKYWYHDSDKENKIPILYNPLRYYLLGNYDIAYISLIDNFKFAHRLFEPTHINDSSENELDFVFKPHTLQNFSGVTNRNSDKLKDFFYSNLQDANPRKYFLGICNLKLNNGLLIGNGMNFIKSVEKHIVKKITELNNYEKIDNDKKIEFLLIQSYSWFELSLLIFTDSPEDISKCVIALRKSMVSEITDCTNIVNNSLYSALKPAEEFNEIYNTNIFADTHTFIGFNSDLVENEINNPYVQNFLKEKINLKTEIEWQIKPGHMHLLKQLISNDENFNNFFKSDKKLMITGKSDYLIEEESDLAANNLHLLRYILDDKNKLFDHVRKIRTKILFPSKEILTNDLRVVSNLSYYLTKLAITNQDISKINEKLKSLKISRQMRLKILKIFSNYNNGIQDIILFNLFLDFKVFVDNLIKFINKEYHKWNDSRSGKCLNSSELNVNSLEKKIVKWLDVFQESYSIRILNGYQFEDIIDLDLDFNSSIEQLLSAYSTISYEIGALFYNEENNKKKKDVQALVGPLEDEMSEFGPIVQLNYKDTVANYLSINYSVHHLTSPEFVFSTITKEVLNSLKEDNNIVQDLMYKYDENIQRMIIDVDSNILSEMVSAKLVDPNYFINDSLRFIINYNLDFKLFYYWFWTYNFQNTSLYDKSGLFNETNFKQELFRILFLKKLYKFEEINLECPIPEIYTYWSRHFDETNEAVNRYYKKLKDENYIEVIHYIVFTFTNDIFNIELEGNNLDNDNEDLNFGKEIKILSNFINDISKLGINEKTQYIENFFKRLCLYNELSKSNNIVVVSDILKLQHFTFDYLFQIYTLNHKKVSLLRRDWSNGKVLNCFLKFADEKHLYSIDQTGGLFFDNMKKLNKYFRLTTRSLNFILDLSLKRKKNFIVKKIKEFDERK